MHPNDKFYISKPNSVFVFGSNDAGIHGAGAAHEAFNMYGAQWGLGEGLSGETYAIPTKTRKLETKLINEISVSVSVFLNFARQRPDLHFFVTRIGCGLAGFTDKEIAPLFQGAPPNVELPLGWEKPETL